MLSIIINVKNGERMLEQVLRLLTVFDDVVLVDNYSTDNTLDIARKFKNTRIYQHEFCGMGKLRNLATSYAKNDWVLVVDCDEVLDYQLVDTLRNMRFTNGCVYALKRHNHYANQWVDSSAWENDWVTRIYNRFETKYTDVDVHEAVVTNGFITKKISPGFIYHFPYTDISGLVSKMQMYSSWYAKQNYLRKKPILSLIPFRAFFMFIKCYILKRGFLDGFEGLAISSYNAIGVFSKYMKLYELYYKCELGLIINVTSLDKMLPLISLINSQQFLPSYVCILVPHHLDSVHDLLDKNLCTPYLIKAVGQKSIKEISQEIFKVVPQIDYIYYLEQIDRLKKHKFLKHVKQQVISNKLSSDIFRRQ